MRLVFAIDPGNTESAYCIIDADSLQPIEFAKLDNTVLAERLSTFGGYDCVIERIASYGMAVGRDVFETCEWVGRYSQIAADNAMAVSYIYRKEEKLHICGDPRAKDANIRRALIDRFAKHDLKNGRGTKNDPDWFYGFKADCWAAYAVGLTWIETVLTKDKGG